jgi:integrase
MFVFFANGGSNTAQDEDDKKTEKLPTIRKLPTLPIRVVLPNVPVRVTNILDDYAALLKEERAAYLANIGRESHDNRHNHVERKSNELHFSKSDLSDFVSHRKIGLAKRSLYWFDLLSDLLWQCTKGEVSSRTLTKLRETVLKKYNSVDSHSKVLSFATSFLKFLATTRSEPQYQAFAPYLELPKALKERKNVTQRIVTKEDIENVLRYIKQAENNGKINTQRSAQYSAFVIFGAFTGQRSMATLANLTVGQFREALHSEKPVLHVESSQDKIRMEHYVPLHPQVVKAIEPILGDRKNEDHIFGYNSFQMWLKRNHIPMSQFDGHFELRDLRKFAEQHGDVIEWEHSNRAYVLTHGVSGVDWSHYKHPLPESVFDVYIRYWKNVSLDI